MRTLFFMLVSLMLIVPCQAIILYVDGDATSANDGSSWENAYRHLQDALADATADPNVSEIRVGQGTYRPDEISADPNGTDDREATFQLVNGVALKGGYAGAGEVDPNDRDWELYESVLSGDLEGDDVGEPSVYNAPLSWDENSYHIVSSDSVDESTIIDGFVITHGNASKQEVPTDGWGGGGMYNYLSYCRIKNCKFIKNYSEWLGGQDSYDGGGGMFNFFGAHAISNCEFIENVSGDLGGAFYSSGDDTQFENCRFIGNNSRYGGVMLNHSSTTTFDNCIFTDGIGGGAILMWNYSNCEINNCIITNHQIGVGVRVLYGSDLTISNSILWSNLSSMEVRGGPFVSNAKVNYCNIPGGESSISIGTNGTLNWLEGNIDTDPNFVDPDNNDYHLQSQAGRYDPTTQTWLQDSITSPCIDAGDPTTSIGWELYPNGGVVNMGAYGGTSEASKSYFRTTPCEEPIAGDINGDCKVDVIDFSIMAFHWLEDNSL